MLTVPTRAEVRSRPLETARLILAPVETTDAREMWSAVESSRPALEKWLPWVPFNTDAEASHRYAEASVNDWDNARACRFAIREKGQGGVHGRRLLGIVGLETFAHLHQSCELGYWLRTDVTGKGYMTEAARVAVHWAFDALGAHRVRVAAATNNHRSLAVIGRLGFHFEGIARHSERVLGRWLDHAVFSLLLSDPRT